MDCHEYLPKIFPKFRGIEKWTEESWPNYSPEYYALLKEECGAVPEGADN